MRPFRLAQNRVKPIFGKIQCSTNTIAPTGMSSRPYTPTKSSSFVKTNGEQAMSVVTPPAMRVTTQRGQFGVTTWSARPAR